MCDRCARTAEAGEALVEGVLEELARISGESHPEIPESVRHDYAEYQVLIALTQLRHRRSPDISIPEIWANYTQMFVQSIKKERR